MKPYHASFVSDPVVRRELQKIAESLASSNEEDVLHKEPENPRQGNRAFADGTDWNPGSGEGLYVYLSTGWSKL